MLSEEERSEYVQLEEGKWTMSGYGPNSDKQQRKNQLWRKMWIETGLEELLEEGEVEVPVFNRKAPYEDIGYQGHLRIEIEREDWSEPVTYTPGFEVDYEEEIVKVENGPDTEVIQEGEEVSDVRTAEGLKDVVL